MSTGLEIIRIERQRQIAEEGYTPQHDQGHASDLVAAAVGYVAFQHVALLNQMTPAEARAAGGHIVPPGWPWSSAHWKPTGDPLRDLAKAGALIAAALDDLLSSESAS